MDLAKQWSETLSYFLTFSFELSLFTAQFLFFMPSNLLEPVEAKAAIKALMEAELIIIATMATIVTEAIIVVVGSRFFKAIMEVVHSVELALYYSSYFLVFSQILQK